MGKNVYIRVDGDEFIGLGHLVRCIALAHMLKTAYDICFVNKAIPGSIKDDIIKAGFQQKSVTEECTFLQILTDTDIVVLDHYGLDSEYQKLIKERKCKLICIDDLHAKEFFADLVINHSPGITHRDYNAQPYTRFALGLDYALLRPSFLQSAKQEKTGRKVESVLICFGGSDRLNLTKRTLEVVLKRKNFKKIIVITGASYQYQGELSDFQNIASVEIYHSIDETRMLHLIKSSDLAIVPASGILLEVLAAGNLIISGLYVDNQENTFKAFNHLGAFINANDFSTEDLENALNQIDKAPEKKIIIDGNSGRRILSLSLDLTKETHCRFRVASINDTDLTYRWAKNVNIRVYSFNKSPISYEGHRNWFLKKIEDSNCYYLIFLCYEKPAGSIRFDIIEEEARISYLLDPEFHGKGLGITLLKLAIEWLCSLRNANIKTIVGEVMSENLPSIKTFNKLYFSETLLNNETIRFEKPYL